MDQVQVYVDCLSGNVYAVPCRSTDTAAYAAKHILDIALRPGDGMPDVLVVEHDPKFTSTMFREFTRPTAPVSSVIQRSTRIKRAKVERDDGVLGDTLRAYADGRKDESNVWLPNAVVAHNNSASTLGGELTPIFIDREPTLACPCRSPTS